MTALAESYREQPLLLGQRNALVGVITRPRDAGDPSTPTIVILNHAIVRRVGHHRMYVTLSRMLASAGRLAVRLDLSRIGDSRGRSELLSPFGSFMAVKEVLDSIQTSHRAARFILVGLCTGADLALLYGRTDPRVVGLVLMDPTLPPTPRYYYHCVLRPWSHFKNWKNALAGCGGFLRLALAHVRQRLGRTRNPNQISLQDLQFSPHLAECYNDAAKRGMKLLAAFTALSAGHAYKQQMLAAFPQISSGGSLQLQSFPNSDQRFSAPQDRSRLLKAIDAWVGVRWPLLMR